MSLGLDAPVSRVRYRARHPAPAAMRLLRHVLTVLPGLLLASALLPTASGAAGYQQPSAAVRELLDTAPLPRLLPSPDRQQLALIEMRRFSTIEDLQRPTLHLAGTRFDAGSSVAPGVAAIQRLRLRALLQPDAPERVVELPAGGLWHDFAWAPDGQRFLIERRMERANELWVGDTASGAVRPIQGLRLNEVLAQGEKAWLNPRELVVLSVPDHRGPPPRLAPQPISEESRGLASPERTHPDLLHGPQDEALFEYHARSVLTWVDLASGASRDLGPPQLYSSVSSVGEGQYLLTERISRPFSYRLPWDDFPTTVEVRQRDGKLIRELARMPLKSGVAIDGVLPGPRVFYASPMKDAAVYWIEALDGGNPAQRVAFRDRVMRLDPPFTGEPLEVQRMPHRFSRLQFLDDGQNALLTEVDRQRAWQRSYLLPLKGTQSKPLFEFSQRERFRHPGSPLTRMLPNGHLVVQTLGGDLLMTGPGASPKGDRPFLDRFSLRDLSAQRLFQSPEGSYETPLAVLEGGKQLLLSRESASEPPNLALRELASGNSLQALTRLKDNTPQLRRIRREFISFKRSDGVDMSFWMYLPPDYKEGERRPTLVWAYPLEYSDASIASQVSGAPNRFLSFNGISPLALLLDGFVVLYDAHMPVVGDLKTVNDGFIEQITMNARAIIDKAEDLGVSDPKRMAVGGHSYGAFMAVNLLAHTDLFRAGIARSGAYNRTLTPFGFQSERRSLWDAKEVYLNLSPLLYAPQIREPLLLLHGEQDGNAGTPPLQSERLYHALSGLGGTVRLTMLPLESHGYSARESAGHVQWEMSRWLKTWLGDPRDNGREPREGKASAPR